MAEKICPRKKKKKEKDDGNNFSGIEIITNNFFRTVYTGEVYLIGELFDDGEGTLAELIEKIQFLDRLGQSITFYISSVGGLLGRAFAIYDILKAIQVKVTTIALGDCHSAAFIIFLAGQTRLASPHTRFMIHPARWGTDRDDCNSLGIHVDEFKRINKLIEDIVKKETSVPFNADAEKDLFFGIEEALKWGVIHDLFEPSPSKKKKRSRKAVS